VFDYCGFVLETKEVDCGPKPFRTGKSFKEVIDDFWNSYKYRALDIHY